MAARCDIVPVKLEKFWVNPARPHLFTLFPPEHTVVTEVTESIQVQTPTLELIHRFDIPVPSADPTNCETSSFAQYAQMLEIQQTLRERTGTNTFLTGAATYPAMTRQNCGDPVPLLTPPVACSVCIDNPTNRQDTPARPFYVYRIHSNHTNEECICKYCLFGHLEAQLGENGGKNNGQFKCFFAPGCAHTISEFQVMKIFDIPIGERQIETRNTLSNVPVPDYRVPVFKRIFCNRIKARYSICDVILEKIRIQENEKVRLEAITREVDERRLSPMIRELARTTNEFSHKNGFSVELEQGIVPVTAETVRENTLTYCPYCFMPYERTNSCFHMSHTCIPEMVIPYVAHKYPMEAGGKAHWCAICARPACATVGPLLAADNATGNPHYRLTARPVVSTYIPNSGVSVHTLPCKGNMDGGIWSGQEEYAARMLTIRDEVIRRYDVLDFDVTSMAVKEAIAMKIDENLAGAGGREFLARVRRCIAATRWDNKVPLKVDIAVRAEKQYMLRELRSRRGNAAAETQAIRLFDAELGLVNAGVPAGGPTVMLIHPDRLTQISNSAISNTALPARTGDAALDIGTLTYAEGYTADAVAAAAAGRPRVLRGTGAQIVLGVAGPRPWPGPAPPTQVQAEAAAARHERAVAAGFVDAEAHEAVQVADYVNLVRSAELERRQARRWQSGYIVGDNPKSYYEDSVAKLEALRTEIARRDAEWFASVGGAEAREEDIQKRKVAVEDRMQVRLRAEYHKDHNSTPHYVKEALRDEERALAMRAGYGGEHPSLEHSRARRYRLESKLIRTYQTALMAYRALMRLWVDLNAENKARDIEIDTEVARRKIRYPDEFETQRISTAKHDVATRAGFADEMAQETELLARELRKEALQNVLEDLINRESRYSGLPARRPTPRDLNFRI